jgi:hypothetical protein
MSAAETGAGEWPYLATEEARARLVLAAHYLAACPHLIEIGGYRTPVADLMGPATREIFGIDPKMPAFEGRNAAGGHVRRVVARFQDVEHPFAEGSYGLALIGCSLKFSKRDPDDKARATAKLRRWVAGARTVVLEYAADWANAHETRALIEGVPGMRVRLDLGLTLPVPPPDAPSFGERRFIVYAAG